MADKHIPNLTLTGIAAIVAIVVMVFQFMYEIDAPFNIVTPPTYTSKSEFEKGNLAGKAGVVLMVNQSGVSGKGTTIPPITARPNIIVIMTDDQDFRTMEETVLGGKKVLQHIDAHLVQQGTTFDNFFSSLSLCCPSRATFLSGQYAHNHGVLGNTPPSGGYAKFDHSNSLPLWLESSGYHTAHIGKYLNGYGIEDASTVPGSPPYEIPPGWSEWYGGVDPSTYKMYDYTLNENGTLVTYGTSTADYQTDVYAAKAVDFIRRRANVSSQQPFFLSLAFLAPHSEGFISSTIPAPHHAMKAVFKTGPLPHPRRLTK